MKNLITVLLVFMSLSGFTYSPAFNDVSYLVTMTDLIRNPERYDGKAVSFTGYPSFGFERTAIFDTHEHYKYHRTENGIWLNLSGGYRVFDMTGKQLPDNYNCEGEPVIIEGVYCSTEKGHFSLYNGSLKKLRITTFENEIQLNTAAKSNLTMYISNQSLNLTPVDIAVFVDSAEAIRDTFDVKGKRVLQHNWIKYNFKIPIGEHQVNVYSKQGMAEIARKIKVDSVLYINIEYHFSNEYTGELKNKKFFHFIESKEEFRFE